MAQHVSPAPAGLGTTDRGEMSDDIDTGPIVAGEVAPAPSERPSPVPPAPDEKSRDQLVKDTFSAGLALTAYGTEDATDYAREREAQDRHLSGEDLSPAQMREWHERTHSALQRAIDAQARARGEVPPSQQQAPQDLPGYVAPDAPDYDQHMAAAQERFSRYFDDPTRIGDQNTAAEHKAAVTNWLTTADPRGELTGYYMASELGPQMAEALANEPQVIPYLLVCPAHSRRSKWQSLRATSQPGYSSNNTQPRESQSRANLRKRRRRSERHEAVPTRPRTRSLSPPKAMSRTM